ncbi:hypothetical protein P154DRAFT_48272 [Amniculicola lignicola CBS 123094]|uniref:Uncharacterized protein n=1 Tax=Amniculicola lignicola CBS 123094 TaxID=1392246 RepID=A0A6A5VWJ0_9PLEO|nr:hypothetical protein P154DRAFT_48272 [Amniculicola lignicola CBS 123094]
MHLLGFLYLGPAMALSIAERAMPDGCTFIFPIVIGGVEAVESKFELDEEQYSSDSENKTAISRYDSFTSDVEYPAPEDASDFSDYMEQVKETLIQFTSIPPTASYCTLGLHFSEDSQLAFKSQDGWEPQIEVWTTAGGFPVDSQGKANLTRHNEPRKIKLFGTIVKTAKGQ